MRASVQAAGAAGGCDLDVWTVGVLQGLSSPAPADQEPPGSAAATLQPSPPPPPPPLQQHGAPQQVGHEPSFHEPPATGVRGSACAEHPAQSAHRT